MRLFPPLSRDRWRQLWYVPLLALAMGLMLARLLLMARLLDVPAFAAYSAALLVSSSFCMLACLGLQSMLQRDLPMMIVRGRERQGAVLVAQCLIVAVACAACGLAAAAAGVSVAGLSPLLLALGLVHGLSQQLFVIATVDSRSRGQPLRFARQNFDRAAVVLASGALTAVLTGSPVWTLVVEAGLSMAMAMAFVLAQLRVRAPGAGGMLRLAWQRLLRVDWRSSGVLLAVASIGFVLTNVDRWVAAQTLPSPRFAQYAFAWLVLMVAQSLQVVINASLFPLLARRFAVSGCVTAFRVCAKASLLLLLAAAVAVFPAWALLDFAIARWFSGYGESTTLLPAFLVAAAFRVSDFWSSFMVIVGKEAHLLAIQLVSGALAACAWWWGVRPAMAQRELLGVAWLALLLGASGYLAAACAAWLTAREAKP